MATKLNRTQPAGQASLFPPRSSSYRAWSIIDMYGDGQGVQLSPPMPPIPYRKDAPQSLLNSVRKLRSDDRVSRQSSVDVDEAYGSGYGTETEKVTPGEEYDPYKQISPIRSSTSKKETGELLYKWNANMTSQDSVVAVVKLAANAPVKEKALPLIPRKEISNPNLKNLPAVPKENEKDDEWRKRKDSLLNSDKGSSAASSPWPKLSPTAYDIQWDKRSPRSPRRAISPQEEKAIQASKSITRTGKPASLILKRSNGSTAASLASTPASDPPVTSPLPPVPTFSNQNLSSSNRSFTGSDVSDVSASPAPKIVDKALPGVTTLPNRERQLPQIPAHVAANAEGSTKATNTSITPSLLRAVEDDAALADDEASSQHPEMKRIINRVVKRKPIENQRQPVDSQDTTVVPSYAESQTDLPTDVTSSTYDTRNQSLESFPKLTSDDSTEGTIVRGKAPSYHTPPNLLPTPSPVAPLEESPSKYGIKKKSVANLRPIPERESRNEPKSPVGVSGPELFKITLGILADYLLHVDQEDAVRARDRVLANEIEWAESNRPSLLPLLQDRRSGTNAPLCGTVQVHCHIDHRNWKEDRNDVHPVDCALCYVSDEDTRWICKHCCFRVCTTCREKIDTLMNDTTLQSLINLAKEETARLLAAQHRSQTETTLTETRSRPPSPARTIGPETAAPYPHRHPYGNPSASRSAVSMRSQRSQPDMRRRARPSDYRDHPPLSAGSSRSGRPHPTMRADRSSNMSVPAPADYPPPPQMPPQGWPQRETYPQGSSRPGVYRPRGASPMRSPMRMRGPPRGGRGGPMTPDMSMTSGLDSLGDQLRRGGGSGPYPDMRR